MAVLAERTGGADTCNERGLRLSKKEHARSLFTFSRGDYKLVEDDAGFC